MKKTAVLITCLSALLCSAAWAKTSTNTLSFGLSMGQKKTAIVKMAVSKHDEFSSFINPPKPEKPFNIYIAHYTNKTGLCQVSGISPEFTNSKLILTEFQKAQANLEKFFGKPTEQMQKYNSKKNLFTQLRSEKNSLIFARWSPKKGNYTEITLGIVAHEKLNKGALVVQYDFKNINECSKVMAQQKR